jgi:hypothetical protein
MTKKVTRQTRHQQRAREDDGPFAVELELAAEDHVKPNGHGQKNHVADGCQPKTFWTGVRTFHTGTASAALQIEPWDNRPARR